MASGAAVLALTQLGASVAGLIRDRALTSVFPGLSIVDVYLAAFRPSDLLFQVCIMSAIGTVMVPLLANYKAKQDKDAMGRLLSSTMYMGAGVFGGIAILLAFALPWIAPYLVQFEGDQLVQYVHFARIALLTNFLFVFGNAAGQYLVTIQRYWIYGLTPILYTTGTIVGTYMFTPYIGAYGPIVGTLCGAIVYVLLRLCGVWISGIRTPFSLWHPDLRDMGLLMFPRMLALGALQIQLLVFDTLASGLDAGSITINAYARNFQSVLVGIAGIAVAQSAYPLMSEALALHDTSRFRIYVRKALTLIIGVTIPGAIALVVLWPVAAMLVNLQTMRMAFAVALGMYAVSIPFESMNHLLLRAFYSMKNTKSPAFVSMLGAVISIGTATIALSKFGVYGIALGFVVGQLIQVVLLSILLPRQLKNIA